MFSDNITFYDLETESTTTNRKEREICDIGACRGNATFHENSLSKFEDFIKGTKFLCGHNILRHDNLYIKNRLEKLNITHFIDTLLLSPLLDPYKPYHYLIKEDNIVGSNSFNNPLKDSQRASKLLEDFIEKYNMLNINIQRILYFLLHEQKDFKGFFEYINVRFIKFGVNLSSLIKREIENKICANAPVDRLIKDYPIELAYTIMLFSQHAEQKKEINWAEVQKEVNEDFDIIGKRALEDSKYVLKTPPWVLMTFPKIEEVVHILRGTNCKSCKYCKGELDEVKALEKYFGYTSFRSFEGKDLQYEAVKAANNDESILAIFPTAGGKSLTFQLPALISGDAENSLTVVISPLQSLMKDQVDVLDKEHGIYNAATLNGLQDPIDRNEEYGKVEKGIASLLYISPEKLRSKSIENLLLKRHIARFVIDEAHCLSSWGHDFRPDYQYIGKFIKSLQEKKGGKRIPVSCFTATAKKEVIEEIKQYFKEILDLELREISTDTRRKNLNYFQIAVNNQEEKFNVLIKLLREKQCPTIIYVSRVKRANELAEKLCARNFKAKAYNAKIDAQEKIKTQDDFKNGNVDIIVATTAFGMGVDKSDVGMVIHYDISDSLENYAQESGRAGRDQKIQADCYIIYNENDLNLHFSLLNQTKLSIKEIQDIWKVVKLLTKGNRKTFSKSPIEIARKAGWDIDGDKSKIETKVITAINSLEQSRFLERGQNEPKIFADSILVKNIMEAREKLEKSPYFKDETRKTNAVRILQSLLSAKSTTFNKEDIPESRVEYIAGNLSLKTKEVMDIVEDLKAAEILSDTQDLKINFTKEGSIKPKKQKLEKFYKIEKIF